MGIREASYKVYRNGVQIGRTGFIYTNDKEERLKKLMNEFPERKGYKFELEFDRKI